VGEFVGARPDDTILFTRNTTDSLNMLAGALPDPCRVIVFETEHHANLLPWRRRERVVLPAPSDSQQALLLLREALDCVPSGYPCLVAVTGASNVTGELWPLDGIVSMAHERGARVAVDGAQLVPHFPVDLQRLGADYLAFSGHKLYAPFGAGVLVGRSDWLRQTEPHLAGGGAVTFVTRDDVMWAGLPDRQEAGSPNVIGAVALAVACQHLQREGLAEIHHMENDLYEQAATALIRIPQVETYRLWPEDHPQIGVLTFNIANLDYALTAEILSAEYGIGVRVSESSAAQLRRRMLEGDRSGVPGAVRASFGVTTTRADVDRFVRAVSEVATAGPRWRYDYRSCEHGFAPSPDPRRRSDVAMSFTP
jgi:selenocysteine lyase/cysteine desulfurase